MFVKRFGEKLSTRETRDLHIYMLYYSLFIFTVPLPSHALVSLVSLFIYSYLF